MAAEYTPSKELEELAQRVIEGNIDLGHLNSPDCRMLFQYSDEAKKSRDKTVYADTEKIKDKLKAFLPYDFIITFYKPNTFTLKPETMEKLMYHELKHVGFAGAGKYSIIPHDVEDFRAVIDKWGLDWI